jgi:hypothetical protein
LVAQKLREGAVVAIAALAFGAAFAWPLLGHLAEVGTPQDWDQMLMYHAIPVDTLLRYHQLPLWNPFMCGGMPMLGNPQSRFLSPFLPLSLLFGPVVGIHLEIPLHLALAFAGGYVLARCLGLSRTAALATAAFFPACSAFTLHFAAGHDGFFSCAYLPWLLACYWTSVQKRRLWPAACGGIVLALMIGEGSTYPAPHAAIWLAVLAAALAISRRNLFPLSAGALLGAVGLSLSATKLLPMLSLMRQYPRQIDSPEIVNPGALIAALFSRNQDFFRTPPGPHLYWMWHEYGAYLGPIAFGLALVGTVTGWRRVWPFALIGAVALCFVGGDFAQGWPSPWTGLSPWGLLRRVPPFTAQHCPSRFLFELAFSASVLAGFGIARLQTIAFFQSRFARFIPLGIVCLGTFDAWLVGAGNLRHVFDIQAEHLPKNEAFTQLRQVWPGGPTTWMYSFALANAGVINCYDPLEPRSAALAVGDPGYRGEYYLEGPGDVRELAWSPNRLRFEVDVPAPTTLVINENNDGGWRLTSGTGGIDAKARLEVNVPAGRQELTVTYRKGSAMAGLFISAMTCLTLLAAAAVKLSRS